MSGRLAGKSAWVTGGGQGIGEAVCLLFAEEGASIAVTDVNLEAAQKVAEQCRGRGAPRASAYALDVSRKADVDAVFARILADLGALDILINNAGVNRDAFAKKMTEEQWDLVLGVNLKGTFLCCQAAIPHMTERGSGAIVNTASIAALGNLGQSNYSASKAGVIGLTKTLALECARGRVRVNCIAPGATMTPMFGKVPAEIQEKVRATIALGRFAEPREIASAHLFLASEDSSYVTGQVLFVDGGAIAGV